MYASSAKIVFLLVVFILWCLCAQWVDRDAERVRTQREKWNVICLASGALGIFAWLIIPWSGWAAFLIGFGMYVFLTGGGILIYVSHRNKRVSKERRVLTAQHFSGLLSRTEDERVDRSKHDYRVRLFSHEKKAVSVPDDLQGAAEFTATQELLYDAMWRRATQVELAATGEDTSLMYWIDGVQAERRDYISSEQAVHAIHYLKRIAGLDMEEHRRPQRGQIQAALLGGTDDPAQIDVLTSGTTAGEHVTLKIVTADTMRSLPELGMHHQRLEMLSEVVKKSKGVIICSGPPQSGVTSTLYAIIRQHDAYIENIHALEKQRLFEVDNITQHTFDPTNREVSYARQLQSVLRREPDVVMVGEVDNKDTARLVVKASSDGKRVHVGMTAANSFDALETFIHLVGHRGAVARELLAVTSQRLLRQLCGTCREAYRPDAALLRKANLPVDKIDHFYRPPTQKIFDKQGLEIVCPSCQGTGYVGRVGVFELLVIDDSIRKMIKAEANITQIRAQARRNKTYYIQEEGLLKAMDGTTSMNEVLRSMRDNSRAR